MKTTTRLRRMLGSGHMVTAPFILNALHAKIAQSVGFEAVYMTGAGTAAERGFPDVGLLTMTEMVANAKYIVGAVDIPVICDADTGYGNPLNVRRTVREYEAAGVAAIHIEDQLFPKKCGFFEGKQVIPQEEMVPKVRAALDARTDPDFVVIARCDACRHRLGRHPAAVPGLHRCRGRYGLRGWNQDRGGPEQLRQRP